MTISGLGKVSPDGFALEVSAATAIHARLQAALYTSSREPSGVFTAVVTTPVKVGSRVAIPSGSILHCSVLLSRRGTILAALGRRGMMALAPMSLVLPDGVSLPLSAHVVSVGGRTANVRGEIIAPLSAGWAAEVLSIGGGAGSGLGAAGGRVGTGLGVGLGAGAAWYLLTSARDLDIPAQASVTVRLDRALRVPAAAATRDSCESGAGGP